MRRALVVALVVVASLLLGTSLSGASPVVDETEAPAAVGLRAATTPPAAVTMASRSTTRMPRPVLLRPLALLVQLLLAAVTFVVGVPRAPDLRRSIGRRHAARRRGPPLLLPSRA
jgi:hypothetical protein